MTLDQAAHLTAAVAASRMKDPYCAQIRIEAEPVVASLESMGVDVNVWKY
jgi:hypothetical protein